MNFLGTFNIPTMTVIATVTATPTATALASNMKREAGSNFTCITYTRYGEVFAK